MAEGEPEYRTLALLDEIEAAERQAFDAVGVGVERRFDLPTTSGFILEYQSKGIHLALLRKEGVSRR